MNNSYILSLKLYLHPRDWRFEIFTDDICTYGVQFLFFAVTLYIYHAPKTPLPLFPEATEYTGQETIKSYCCEKDILIGIKFKCKDCGSCNTEAKNKLTCTGCGTEVNQMGGKYIE